MNNDRKFNIFIGVGALLIFIVVGVLSLMSAIEERKNSDNVIDIDGGSEYSLNVPKSNLVVEHVNIEKDIASKSATLHVNVKLPKINIDSNAAKGINNKIYNLYLELDNYAKTIKEDESILFSYIYDYIGDNILEIIIVKTKKTNADTVQTETKYVYDAENDKEINNI